MIDIMGTFMEDVLYIEGKQICVDIDGILCDTTHMTDGELDYNYSVPDTQTIALFNIAFEKNRITIFTARGRRTGKKDWSEFTKKQLASWGVKYHEIRFDKPHYDVFIDDKAVRDLRQFFRCIKK